MRSVALPCARLLTHLRAGWAVTTIDHGERRYADALVELAGHATRCGDSAARWRSASASPGDHQPRDARRRGRCAGWDARASGPDRYADCAAPRVRRERHSCSPWGGFSRGRRGSRSQVALRSRRGVRCMRVTAGASGRGATARHRGRRRTTSGTGRMADRPISATLCCCVIAIIGWCTRVGGNSSAVTTVRSVRSRRFLWCAGSHGRRMHRPTGED